MDIYDIGYDILVETNGVNEKIEVKIKYGAQNAHFVVDQNGAKFFDVLFPSFPSSSSSDCPSRFIFILFDYPNDNNYVNYNNNNNNNKMDNEEVVGRRGEEGVIQVFGFDRELAEEDIREIQSISSHYLNIQSSELEIKYQQNNQLEISINDRSFDDKTLLELFCLGINTRHPYFDSTILMSTNCFSHSEMNLFDDYQLTSNAIHFSSSLFYMFHFYLFIYF